MICDTRPLLDAYSLSPLYTGLMVWVPPVRLLTASIACPPLSATVPRTVVPFLNDAFPPGVPMLPLTAVVNVTFCPEVDGSALVVTAVLSGTPVMVCLRETFAGASDESALYCTSMVCLPTAIAGKLRDPDSRTVWDPICGFHLCLQKRHNVGRFAVMPYHAVVLRQ